MAKAKPEPKSVTQASNDYRDELKRRGGGRFPTLTLDPEEMALWEQLVKAHGGKGRGEAKRTLMAALRALSAKNDLTPKEVKAWIDRLAAEAAK